MQNIDQQLFYFINHNLHIGVLNKVLPYWRSMYFWIPLYVFFASYLIFNYKKNGLIYILALAMTVGTADIVSSRLIKNTVQRLRPCQDEAVKASVNLLVRCGGGYSFTSSHATNHFAAAIFVAFTYVLRRRLWRVGLLFWAASIAFGQVYVGVHYPFDVICGAIIGSLIGYIGSFLYKKYLNVSPIGNWRT